MNRARRLAVTGIRRLWLPAVVIVAWWITSAGSSSPYFPPFADILRAFRDDWIFRQVPADLAPSMWRLMAGLVLSCALGIGAGILLGRSSFAQRMVGPFLQFVWSTPKFALLPAAIVIMGFGDSMKVVFIVVGAIWPILLNTIDGVRGIDTAVNDTARSFRLSAWTRLTRIILPAAAPQILVGIRTATMISLGLLVVSEMLGSHNGVGFEVLQAQQSYRIADMWAGVLLLGIIGFLLSKVFDLIEHHALRWHLARRRTLAAGPSR